MKWASKMKTTDIASLLRAVESIRAARHPDLDVEFVRAVLEAEEANPDDDGEALRAIRQALNTMVSRKGVL